MYVFRWWGWHETWFLYMLMTPVYRFLWWGEQAVGDVCRLRRASRTPSFDVINNVFMYSVYWYGTSHTYCDGGITNLFISSSTVPVSSAATHIRSAMVGLTLLISVWLAHIHIHLPAEGIAAFDICVYTQRNAIYIFLVIALPSYS